MSDHEYLLYLEAEKDRRRSQQASQQTATSDLTAYRDDPVAFVADVLGIEPWEKQRQILQALATEPRVTVRSCNGAGKTICAAWAALWFLYTRPGSIVITTAPTKNQVVNLLWRRLRTAFAHASVRLPGRCLTAMLECGTDWYAQGMATDEEVNFQGPHSPAGVLMVGDEAAGLAPWLFAAMAGTMTEEGAKMLLIGNPNIAAGYFYDSHNLWPAEQKFHISAFDVPPSIIRPGWIEQMRADHGGDEAESNPVYQVRVLGEFPEQGEDSLISRKWVTAAQQRQKVSAGGLELGLDVGRYGNDESGYYIRQGGRVIASAFWKGKSVTETAGRTAAAAREWGVSLIKVDDVGVGGGVTDILAEQKLPVQGVNVGEAADDREKYANRRSELFFGLAERFREGDIIIPADDPLLLDQLVALRKRYTERGQMKLPSKEDMKKERKGLAWESPDRADALMLCFAPPGRGYRPAAALGPGRAMPRVVR